MTWKVEISFGICFGMLSLYVISDRTSVLFFSEGYHCSFHMELFGEAQWRQSCCSKTCAGTVAPYFPETAFCFMLVQPLKRESRGLISIWTHHHASMHCYLAFLTSSCDYMGSLFGCHGITLDEATCRNNIYLFPCKTGRLKSRGSATAGSYCREKKRTWVPHAGNSNMQPKSGQDWMKREQAQQACWGKGTGWESWWGG